MPSRLKKFLFGYNGLLLLALLIFSVLLQFLYVDREAPFLSQWISTLIAIALCMVAGYFVAIKLVPGLLYKKMKEKFILWILLISLGNALLIYLVAGSFYASLSGRDLFPNLLYFLYMITFFFIANLIVIMVAVGVRIVSDRYMMEDMLKQIEHDKVKTELDFLRAQINPHFLFNVLNTIYFQIRPDNTATLDLVERLSEILRYQLYECNTDKIDIKREVENLKNFVSIQKFRLEPDTNISFEIRDALPDFKIAPLLIITLVENAFKHLSSFKNNTGNQLHIYISNPKKGIFDFRISNTFSNTSPNTSLAPSSGMGLVNLRRRLELLYPGRHVLEIRKDGIWHYTKLVIVYDDQLSFSG